MPLTPLQRDESGNVIPHDHPGILAGDRLIRRISDQQVIVDKFGQKRISSMAFKPSSGPNPGMSIDLEAQIIEAGLDAREFVTTPRWTGSVYFEAGDVRAIGLQAGPDPLPDNPFHGEVWGIKSKADQRSLQSIAVWFVEIPGVLVAS